MTRREEKRKRDDDFLRRESAVGVVASFSREY